MTIAYSDIITNLRAGTKFSSKNSGGTLGFSSSKVAVLTTDIDDNDIIHLGIVPFSAKIKSIKLFNDDLDAHVCPTLAYDLGVYYGQDGLSYSEGDLIDRDSYVLSAAHLQGAVTVGTELAYSVRDINVDQEVWEDAGLASNPGGNAFITMTIETVGATAAGGDLRLEIIYSND